MVETKIQLYCPRWVPVEISRGPEISTGIDKKLFLDQFHNLICCAGMKTSPCAKAFLDHTKGHFGRFWALGSHKWKKSQTSGADIFWNMAPIENLNANSHGPKSVKEHVSGASKPLRGILDPFWTILSIFVKKVISVQNGRNPNSVILPKVGTRRNFSRPRNFYGDR